MGRKALVLLALLPLSGCMSVDSGEGYGGGGGGYGGGGHTSGYRGHDMAPPAVPGMVGPWGQNVPMAPPYSAAPPGAMAAQAMLSNSVPLSMVQMNGRAPGGALTPPGGLISPPGMPFAPGVPGNGVITAGNPPAGLNSGGIVQAAYPPGAVAAVGAMTNGPHFPVQRTQVRFVRPSSMKVSWFTQGVDGKPSYSANPIEVPGRYNFLQGAIYRLKLGNIEGRPGLEVYPTLEVVPTNERTEAFLAHSSVPVEFTEEDFKQIAQGNYVVKVIYLPDPQFQELAGTGTEEILSTRLEPGADPINEALRRGSILLVIRMGNMDQEAPNTPPISAPGPMGAPMGPPPGMMVPPGMNPNMPPGPMVPYFGVNQGPPMMGPPPGYMKPPAAMISPGGPGPNFPPAMPQPGFGPNGPMPYGPGFPANAGPGPGGPPPGFQPMPSPIPGQGAPFGAPPATSPGPFPSFAPGAGGPSSRLPDSTSAAQPASATTGNPPPLPTR